MPFLLAEILNFQGSTHRIGVGSFSNLYFNSRPCGRGFVRSVHPAAPYNLFQFTPLREGLPGVLRDPHVSVPISIHAPAGGASTGGVSRYTCLLISIHAPAGGASASVIAKYFWFHHFNSRPCGRGFRDGIAYGKSPPQFQFTPLREGLPGIQGITAGLLLISIHAPAGGASVTGYKLGIMYGISIHAPAGGASLLLIGRQLSLRYFNSRPCGRGFTGGVSHATPAYLFQFTPLREGLPLSLIQLVIRLISIHAPAGGASTAS